MWRLVCGVVTWPSHEGCGCRISIVCRVLGVYHKSVTPPDAEVGQAISTGTDRVIWMVFGDCTTVRTKMELQIPGYLQAYNLQLSKF